MPLLNTRTDFGSLHRLLHWSIVVLVCAAYVSTIYATNFMERSTPQWQNVNRVHQALGLTILALASVMLVLRLIRPRPRAEHANKFEAIVAYLAHGAIYFLLLALPITGYLGGTRPRDFFGIYTLPSFKSSAAFEWISQTFGITYAQFEAPMDFFHRELAGPWALSVLIVLHTAAALLHHIHRRDDTLVRMAPGVFRRRVKTAPATAPEN